MIRALLPMLLACSLFARASGQEQVTDIQDSISVLTDSLKLWANTTQMSQQDPPDSLDWAALFPGAEILLDASAADMAFRIELPRYLDRLSTSLIYHKSPANAATGAWELPLSVSDSAIWLDEEPAAYDRRALNAPGRSKLLRDLLLELRTAGLPASLRHTATHTEARQVLLRVHGRQIAEIPADPCCWMGAICRMAQAGQVYAGIIDCRSNSSAWQLRLYALITSPNARGHHFLEFHWRFPSTPDRTVSDSLTVDVIPYVRTDNLKSLFGDARSQVESPIPVFIGRNPTKPK